MGSEGRGEQTFRTDQDNGLILAAPAPEAEIEKFRADVFDALAQCRLPALPGRSDGAQSRVVEDVRGISRRFPPLARVPG